MSEESYIQQLFADRIGGANFGKETVLYKFEKIKRAKAAAIKAHPDMEVIDLGVGEPDQMADMKVVNVLAEEAARPENRGYADNGIQEYKDAAARYLKTVYGVDIDPVNEVNHAIGSKSALALLPYAFINPGDVTLMTVPGYGVLGTITQWLGGEVVNLPLYEENGFLPDLDAVPEDVCKHAKLMYLNYPNNPTGAVATIDFLERVVDFAKKNHILVVYDAAYAALVYDGERPLSFLSVPGAKEVGVEIHSMSKAFNMTGWRLGFVAGNERAVRAFATVKDNNDSGQFKAIQKASIYALDHPEITERICQKYSRRHDMLSQALAGLGFKAKKPRGTFYEYMPIPKGIEGGPQFKTAEDFSQWLLTERLISTVPWDDAGHFIRLSVTFQANGEDDDRRVVGEIVRRLSDVRFEF